MPLAFAADINADMPAGQRDFAVVIGSDMRAERLRTGGRDDVVLQRVDVKNRHGEIGQINPLARKLEGALHQAVFLIKLDHPLQSRGARVVGPVCEPFFHAQEIKQPLFIAGRFHQVEVVFGQRPHRGHHLEDRGDNFTRQVAKGIHHLVNVVILQTARPDV